MNADLIDRTTNPLITPCGNGYALVIESPTGLVAVELDMIDADRCFDAGVNYVPELAYDQSDILDALQPLL